MKPALSIFFFLLLYHQIETLTRCAALSQFVISFFSQTYAYFTGDFSSSNISCNGQQFAVAAMACC